MEATTVDLRYKTSNILKALDRNESVTVLYHGKIKGIIQPAGKRTSLKVKDHPFFGMAENYDTSVLEEPDNLRKPRHDL